MALNPRPQALEGREGGRAIQFKWVSAGEVGEEAGVSRLSLQGLTSLRLSGHRPQGEPGPQSQGSQGPEEEANQRLS